MNDLLLFPFNGNAREAITTIETINEKKKQWNILGFFDDDKNNMKREIQGYHLLGQRDILDRYPQAKVLAVPGSSETHLQRRKIINSLNIPKERFATIIHPDSSISHDTKIGFNTLIMAGVVTTSNVTIGNHCVILPNTVISHDSVIKDYCLVGSNVTVSGRVVLEELCYIGSGTRFIQDICIGEGTLAGIGSVILKSTEPYSVVVGVPARFLRKNV